MHQTLFSPRVANRTGDGHRNAYNAAFEELSLSWRWDADTYARLQMHGRDLVRAYLEAEQNHLLRAYDADFLVNAIEAVKARCFDPVPGHIAPGDRMMQVANDAGQSREASCRASA
jgi:hypothetical protein